MNAGLWETNGIAAYHVEKSMRLLWENLPSTLVQQGRREDGCHCSVTFDDARRIGSRTLW